jgi:formylglycine-generating enzyme required for sulfatase activity
MQVRKAVEQRDAATFEKYVDLEGLIRRAGNQLSTQWSSTFAKELRGFGGIEPEAVNGMMAAFGSAMLEPTVKQVRESILSFLETGRATPIQSIPGDAMDIAADLRIDSMPTIESQGKMATIDINLSAQGEPVRVRLFMRNLGSHWQIAEIDEAGKTAQEILTAYARGERKRIETERAANPDRSVAIPGLANDAKPFVLSYIPSGKFMMGSPSNETGRQEDEGPRHRVNITRPFWMGKHEVTNAQFEAFVKATSYVTTAEKAGGGFGWDVTKKGWGSVKGVTWRKPGFPWEPEGRSGDLPVVMVSWDDATAFCKWLSGVAGETIGLPTEAQWEYACRAGGTTQYWWGDSQQSACQFANVFNQENKGKWGMNWDAFPCSDGYVGLASVGSFQPNAFGLHDTTGNVWEWCADWYDEGYYASSPKDDPAGPAAGSYRVNRGGGGAGAPVFCRSALRGRCTPVDRDNNLGFRLAASPAVR